MRPAAASPASFVSVAFLTSREIDSVIEPIARRLTSWWDEWAREWKAAGGREDEWRFAVELPDRLALMDKAAGLDHRELTGRSLWLPGNSGSV